MPPEPFTSSDLERLDQAQADAICDRHERLILGKPGGIRAHFALKDLSAVDLRGRNLVDADFTGAKLATCLLRGAKLDNANFHRSDLRGADLSGASLRRADLRGACLSDANLTEVDLFEADLREGLAFAEIDFRGIRRSQVRPTGGAGLPAVFAGASLERSRLAGILAIRADFTNALLRGANLARANLSGSAMTGADLAAANLTGTDLQGADMRKVVLMGAVTRGWNIHGADMAGVLSDELQSQAPPGQTYLSLLQDHATWCRSNGREGSTYAFDGADLRGLTQLAGLTLTALSARNAIFYALDLEGVQMQGANLQGADLRACNLRNADLRGAQLTNCKLDGSDLTGANLGPLQLRQGRRLSVDLAGASLRGTRLPGTNMAQNIAA